jgi:cytochrome c oxidase subunit II
MRRRPAFVAFALGAAGLLAACDGRNPSILNPQGPRAEEAAFLWWLMLGLSAPVLLLVTALLVGIIVRSRRRDADAFTPPESASGPTTAHRRSLAWIVAGGIVLPVVLIVPLSVVTLFSLNRMEAPPDDDHLVVEVVGHRFWWEVRYPGTDAVTANEIHIPVGRDVRFVLTTADVIHSFWAANLGGKRDMIPGEVNDVVYRTDEPGVYEGVCAEFCGVQHTWMRMLIVAQPPDEFEAWLENQAADANAPETDSQALGLATFFEAGCASCHQIRGTGADARIGPDLTHFGERMTLGSVTVENNRGNLGGWISNPHGIKPGTTMPAVPLTGEQLNGLIDYLEALR